MIKYIVRNLHTTHILFDASEMLAKAQSTKIFSPRQLKSFLDEYIIGQTIGKKVLSVAAYNHYLRINDRKKRMENAFQKQLLEYEQQKQTHKRSPVYSENSESQLGLRNLANQLSSIPSQKYDNIELTKSNILLIGPSGCGKTLLAFTLARILNVPIAVTDCTQLTQAGYTGENVEICIERLLINANYDVSRAETGIIILDEVDKLAKLSKNAGTKDVSGEGVQQSLLKILEGHCVNIHTKVPTNAQERCKNGKISSQKEETFVVNTSNILFILMGAFVGLDKHIKRRISLLTNSRAENSYLENNIDNLKVSNMIEEINLSSGKKVSALGLTSPIDLINFGLIPELVGRTPIITALEPLQQNDLYHILKDPKNSLLSQYQYIFQQFGVKLHITEKALRYITSLALKEGTGARGLRSIMERVLLNVNYECPGSDISYVLIDTETVASLQQDEHFLNAHASPKYYSKTQKYQFIQDIAKEEIIESKDLDI